MIKFSRLLLAAVVTLFFVAGTSMAGEGFRGLSFGVIANTADMTTKGYEKDLAPTWGDQSEDSTKIEIADSTIVRDIDFPSFFVEYSFGDQIAMTVGAEHIPGTHVIGHKSRSDTTNSKCSGDDCDTATYTGKAEVENLTSIYFEPAIMVNDYIGIYAKAGASHMTINTLETVKDSSYPNADVLGGMYGVGIKLMSPWGLFVKLESTKTQFQTIRLESRTGNKNIISAKPELESTRLAIGYNF